MIKVKTFSATLLLASLALATLPSVIFAANEALTLHNKLRRLHTAPDLQWDAGLAEYAARYAAQCHFRHSKGGYGENLATGFPDTSTAIHAWYDEHNDYSYQRPQFSSTTGHFTQMVWKSTTKLGCASYPCNGKNGTQGDFLVCEYSPQGNVMNRGYFARNVLPISINNLA
jgi:hypothetical protein